MDKYSADNKIQDKNPGLLFWQWMLLYFILGILFYQYPIPTGVSACILLVLQGGQIRNIGYLLIVLIVFGLGYGLVQVKIPKQNQEIPLCIKDRKKLIVFGQVERVQFKPENRLQIILSKVRYRHNGSRYQLGQKVVWKWQDPLSYPAPGQTITGKFRLKPIKGYINPGTWDTRFYWRLKGVGYRTYSQGQKSRIEIKGSPGRLWQLRLRLRQEIIDSTKPGPGQGLLLALLMGDRSKLSYSTLDLVRKGSLAHSLALSGLHLGFLVSLGWVLAWLAVKLYPKLCLFLPKQKLFIFISLPLILAYLWLGQGKPSLLRASLMFFFWGLLLVQGRNKVFLDGLFFALLVIIIFSPLAVYDLGLQLSVVAVAGIIAIWPLFYNFIQKWIGAFRGKGIALAILGLLGISLIANLSLMPLLIWNFGQVSPHLYLNLLWLPVLGWIALPLGLIGLVLILLPGLGWLAAFLFQGSALVLDFLIQCLVYWQSLDVLDVLVPRRPLWPEIVVYWLFLGLLIIWWYRPRSLPVWPILLGVFFLGLSETYQNINRTQNIELRLIDIGQGQSVFIETPKGQRILIDGGGSWNPDFDLGRFALSPALSWGKRPKIDKVVLSHDDFDHLRGLYYILERYQVQEFVYNGNWPEGWDGKRLRTIIDQGNIPVSTWKTGKQIDLDNGLVLQVLHPPRKAQDYDNNDSSLVLRLVYKQKSLALIPGDIEQSGLQALLSSGQDLQAKVLILPHHGSRSSLSQELYTRVKPSLALISCGYLNHFGFPHEQVKNALKSLNIPVLTTAQNGAIMVSWDIGTGKMDIQTGRMR